MIGTKICPAGTHCPPGTLEKPDLHNSTYACWTGHYCLRGDEVHFVDFYTFHTFHTTFNQIYRIPRQQNDPGQHEVSTRSALEPGLQSRVQCANLYDILSTRLVDNSLFFFPTECLSDQVSKRNL